MDLPPSLRIPQSFSFTIDRGHIVENKIIAYPEKLPETLFEKPLKQVLLLKELIQSPVETDRIHRKIRNAAQIGQSCPASSISPR